MLTAKECRAKAEEAEALAKLVSLETDRKRLAEMARAWRERAEAAAAPKSEPPPGRRSPRRS